MRRACLDVSLGSPPKELRSADSIVLLTCDIHRSFICLLPWSIMYCEDSAHHWEHSSNQPDWLEQMYSLSGSNPLFDMHNGMCQGMSWQHLHQPVWLGRCNTHTNTHTLSLSPILRVAALLSLPGCTKCCYCWCGFSFYLTHDVIVNVTYSQPQCCCYCCKNMSMHRAARRATGPAIVTPWPPGCARA